MVNTKFISSQQNEKFAIFSYSGRIMEYLLEVE